MSTLGLSTLGLGWFTNVVEFAPDESLQVVAEPRSHAGDGVSAIQNRLKQHGCQATGDTKLDNIEGIGPVRMQLFSAAGFVHVHDIRDLPDEGAALARLEEAVQTMGAHPETWQRAVRLCMGVVSKLRNPDAAPFVPEHLACPITLDLMDHPVVTSTGHTYERWALDKLIDTNMKDDLPPVDHTNTPIRPMRVTHQPSPTDYYATNYAMKDAIGYYKRHGMRFDILLKSSFRR